MNRTVLYIFSFILFSFAEQVPAANFELIPRLNKSYGTYHTYHAYYFDYNQSRAYLCGVSFDAKTEVLDGSCGAVINFNWKLAKSTNVKTHIIGNLDDSVSDPSIPFAIWQIDEVTGDWQFCLPGIYKSDKCILFKKP